jgi:hypothetical protein
MRGCGAQNIGRTTMIQQGSVTFISQIQMLTGRFKNLSQTELRCDIVPLLVSGIEYSAFLLVSSTRQVTSESAESSRSSSLKRPARAVFLAKRTTQKENAQPFARLGALRLSGLGRDLLA